MFLPSVDHDRWQIGSVESIGHQATEIEHRVPVRDRLAGCRARFYLVAAAGGEIKMKRRPGTRNTDPCIITQRVSSNERFLLQRCTSVQSIHLLHKS